MPVGRDARDLIEEMVAELQLIQECISSMDIEDFLEDLTVQHAVERALEILGEASKGLPPSIVRDHPHVPWSDMAKMRDVLIHAYHRVEPRAVWKTAVEDALPLIAYLEDVLDSLKSTAPDEGEDLV